MDKEYEILKEKYEMLKAENEELKRHLEWCKSIAERLVNQLRVAMDK